MFKYLNPNELAEMLQRGKVPAVPQVIFIAANVVIQCLLGRPGLIGPLASATTLPFALFQMAMTLAALWVGYRANGGANGVDFLLRFVTLGSLIYLYVYLAGFAIYIFAYRITIAAMGAGASEIFKQYGQAQLIFAAAVSLAFILAIQHFLSRVAGNRAT